MLSPVGAFEYSPGSLGAKHVGLALTNLPYDLVHLFRNTFRCVVADELRQRAAVEFAPGGVQTLRKALGLCEDLIGDGDCNLHTNSITSETTSSQSLTLLASAGRGGELDVFVSHPEPLGRARYSNCPIAVNAEVSS